jgi:S1-C subfamily serine protease
MHPGTSPTTTDIASRALLSVVEVVTEDGTGSGVAVDAGILTGAYLVDQASCIRTVDHDGQSAPATILRIDRLADLALLQTSLDVPPLEMEPVGERREGDEVLVLGPNHGGALVDLRGKLIGIPLAGPAGTVAVATDTVFAFLQAPFDTVTPAPPTPIFRGDPRTIAPSAAQLGGGAVWALLATDTSHLRDGLYGEQFAVEPTGDPAITVVVGVLPGVRSAVEQWPPLAAPSDASFVACPVNPLGDASYGALSIKKQTLTISVRTRNVLLSVEITSSSYLTAAGAMEQLLAQMIERVNAGAR